MKSNPSPGLEWRHNPRKALSHDRAAQHSADQNLKALNSTKSAERSQKIEMLSRLFHSRRKDLVCISYPKSGRTWVRYAFHIADVPVRFTHAGHGTNDPVQIGRKFSSVKPEYFGDRNIFLHRNPLDTAVSVYFQIHKRNLTPQNDRFPQILERLTESNLLPPDNIDEFVLHPVWGCRNICAYNAAHIAYFNGRRDSLIVRYEDLRADSESRFSELLRFLGKRRFNIGRIVAESSFDNMRKAEVASTSESKRVHKLYGMRGEDPDTLKVRKGKVGGYTDYLKPATIESASVIAGEFGFVI